MLNTGLAITWLAIITDLSHMAQGGPIHCGTFYIVIHIQMQILSLASLLILIWALSAYRSCHAAMTTVGRFLARLPLCALVALNLAYWGTNPFITRF